MSEGNGGIKGASMYFSKKASLFLCVAAFSCAFLGPVSSAQANKKYKQLNEEIVSDFIIQTTEITKSDRNIQVIKNYLKRHLDDDARFKSSMTYNIPGFPPKQSALALDKDDYISSIEESKDSLGDYSSAVQIDEIKISTDKRTATVFTTGAEEGVIEVPNGSTTERIPINGFSKCMQIVRLSKKDIPQLYSANCETVMNFSQ